MATSKVDQLLDNNKQYASRQPLHDSAFPGSKPIRPAKRIAVVACMDARLDVEDLLGLQTGDAHIIRNAGGVVTEDVIRSLAISHHLLDTNEIILIHHTRCGMLAFTDDLMKAGLEGDAAAVQALSNATGRNFVSCQRSAESPPAFHAFRGQPEALDSPPDVRNAERLAWDVRRSMSAIANHPWIPVSGSDAVTVRGFVYDVDTARLEEISYPGPVGSYA
jgi:carbonic anhydrase